MKYGIFLVLLCVAAGCNAQHVVDVPLNKTYTREVGSSCHSFADGGCLITTFESMRFSSDSVYITQYTKADCDVPARNGRYEHATQTGRYSYQVQKKKNSPNRIIRIDGYKSGSWELDDSHLSEMNANRTAYNKISYSLD